MAAAQIREYRPLSSGKVTGVITIELPSGMVLHGCMVLKTDDGRRWVAAPSKVRVFGTDVRTGADGRPVYDPVVSFVDRDKSDAFSAMALAALDEHLAGGDQ